MSARKTINVGLIIDKANNFFANSTTTPEARKVVQSFVEDILHETGNYEGFGYTKESGFKSGDATTDGLPTWEDDSRIFFYKHNRLL